MARGDKKKGGARRPPRKRKAAAKKPPPKPADLASLPIGGEIDFTAGATKPRKPHPLKEKVPSRIEMERRIRSVEDRLRDGLTDGEIRNELMSHCLVGCEKGCAEHDPGRHRRGCPIECRRHLGVKRAAAENYIKRAYDRLRELATPEERGARDQIIAMLHRAYQGCMQIGDYAGAAAVTMKIARIKGIIDADPNTTNVLALLNALPSDKERFAGDRNYQLLALLRDAAASSAARGNPKAAAAAAKVSAMMVDSYGINQTSIGDPEEEAIAQRVRARVITISKFGDEPVEKIEAHDADGRQVPAVNDFAAEQVAAKKNKGQE